MSAHLNPPDPEHNSPFGASNVSAADKPRLVRAVFDKVADHYDVMNDVMSGGIHRLWKNAMIDWLAPQPDSALLDVAGGTGDIAFRVFERVRRHARPRRPVAAAITVCDINPSMLAVGQARARQKYGAAASVFEWVNGDAENLPFPDHSFDAYTIAFGIRNVTHIDRALAEAYRVLRPGGRFLCLEFSTLQVPGFDQLYEAYSFRVVPKLGVLIAGEGDAYQYLVESIRRFPDQESFQDLIEQAGFAQVCWRNLSGGIVALHSAWRI